MEIRALTAAVLRAIAFAVKIVNFLGFSLQQTSKICILKR
ncbi:hypothetical protein CKA32_003608 [Geitlerinema sp. FC II]|nr:hypothetical protein CKA32_003608 [Geitlerinema sp. FC II]